jgi:hypothetical protein
MFTDRRDFLKVATASLVAPALLWDYKPKQMDWDLRFYQLPFYPDSDSFIQHQKYEIIKGPYSVKTYATAGQDLLDCHGLCATIEMADLIKQELEYGSEGLKKLWELGWDCPQAERDYWLKKLKRVEISGIERCKIVLFCNKLRGKHPCCLPSKRSIWGRVEKGIQKLEPTWKLEIKEAPHC